MADFLNRSCLENERKIQKKDTKIAQILKGYAANTHVGLVREQNEDRVSIILNIARPQNWNRGRWPNCYFFGVYDGHGGSVCSDFLKENLHKYVTNDPSFPYDCETALRRGFAEAENIFCSMALQDKEKIETSGSCAVVLLLVDDQCYLANVGDSRAVCSLNYGNISRALTRDHKPCDVLE